MDKIKLHDPKTDLTGEIEAISGKLVGRLAEVLKGSSKEEKVSALAVVVNYFKVSQGLDMEKFQALLVLCDVTEDSLKYTTGYNGPRVLA